MADWERTGTEDAPVWVLEWDHRPGLVVRCTVPSLRVRVLADQLAPLFSRQGNRALLTLAEAFAEDCLLSWNLRWDGRPRECSAAGIARVDEPLVSEILHAWLSQWVPRPPESEPEPELDAELAALSVDITSPPEGEDTAEAGLVMAGG